MLDGVSQLPVGMYQQQFTLQAQQLHPFYLHCIRQLQEVISHYGQVRVRKCTCMFVNKDTAALYNRIALPELC